MRNYSIIITASIILNIFFMERSIADNFKSRELSISYKDIRFGVNVGHLTAQANEYLYYGERMISRLIWDVKSAQTIEARGELDLSDRWMIYGSGTAAMHRRGLMTDYDYLAPNLDWTDRSKTPDTRLDHYFAVDAGARYKYLETEHTSMTAGFGFRYVNFQMTTYGGDYIYSSCGYDDSPGCFRSIIGSFPSDLRGVTYSQELPAGFLEMGMSRTLGRIRFDLAVLAGLTSGSNDRDMHWARNLLSKPSFGPTPYGAVQANISTNISETFELFASARVEKFFKGRGNVVAQDLNDGTFWPDTPEVGFSFSSVNLGVGLRVAF